jgi:hypothetical protein
MLRKRTLFVIFCALVFLVFAGYAARGPIGSTFFEWYLKGYCRACLSSRLSFKDLRHEKGEWIFEHPVLTTKKRLEEGGYRIQADKATLNVSPSWWKPSLNFSVEFENPVVDIGNQAEEFRKLVRQPYQTFHLFEIHTKINVPQGTILVHDFTDDHLVPVPLFFHIDLACKNTREGCASFWIGEQKNDHILVTFSENEAAEPQIALDLHNVCCASARQILNGILPKYQSLEVSKGNLNGHVILTLTENGSQNAEGQISLKDLVLHDKVIDLDIAIPEAVLNLAPNTSQTIGRLNLSPSSVELKKDGLPFWSLHEAKGSALFNQEDHLHFSLTGSITDNGKVRQLQINGMGSFGDPEQISYFLDMELKGENPETDASFHFAARKLGDQWGFGEVEMLGFGIEELELARHLIQKQYPKWSSVQLHRGNIDAAMLVYFKGFHLSEVHVERIAAYDMSFSYDPWGLNASVDYALGSLSFDLLNENPKKTLDADLEISQGILNLDAIGLDNASWQLSGIDTSLKVDKGVIQKSLLKGTIAGLHGEVVLDGTSDGPLALFDFQGGMTDFAKAVPETVHKGLDKKFTGDRLRILGHADGSEEGLVFDTVASIETADKQPEEIRFGFTLARSPLSLTVDYHLKAGLSAIHAMMPVLAQPVSYLISHNLIFSGFTLKSGWFRADQLPLDKYLSAFLFTEDQMELFGIGDFSGTFDQQKILVHYDVQDMALKNDDFDIEIKHLSEPNTLAAIYTYDFDKQTGYNAFPIRKGTYFEKNSGLLFTEVDANLSIDGSVAHFDRLTAFCNGLYFAGSAVVDWSLPGEGVFNIDLHAQEMHGKISQLQHLLSHINKSMVFLKIPLEGNVGLQKNGGNLNFAFNQNGYELEAIIQGTMTDGTMTDQNMDLSLQELGLNFDYDYKTNKMAFTDVQGTLLVGKPSHVEEYTVSGDGVRFSDYSKNEGVFDLWIGEKNRDILRLTGKMRGEVNDNGNSSVNFLFNRYLTHFGGIHPSEIKLALKDWSQLEKLDVQFEFQLNELLADLKKFSRTGFFFLSRGLLKELNDLESARGAIKGGLNYDPERSTFHYQIDGQDLALGNREFDHFLLTGTKKGSLWSVNQMQIDHISLAFDVMKEGPLWNINFLGAKLGNYLLLGMEGQYSDEEARLEARINFLEMDLSHLNHLPILESFLQPDFISGMLKGSGTLHAHFDKTVPRGVDFNLQLNTFLANGRIKSIYFDDIKNMTVRYDTAQGLTVRNADIGIKSPENQLMAQLFLQEADWNTSDHELLLDGLRFDIPSENIPWAVKILQKQFPDKITDSVADALRSSKDQGSLQGILRFSSGEPYSSLRVHLNDGLYHFKGKEYNLTGFVMDYDPFALKVFTEYRYLNRRLRIDAHTSPPDFDEGEMLVSEVAAGGTHHPLKILWKMHPQAGFYIQKVSGELSGMAFDLVRDPSKVLSNDYLHLAGKMDINFRKALGMMEDETAAKIASLELGEGYSLNGQWSIGKSRGQPLSESLYFQGELNGGDFEILGYRFYNLSSQFTYTPEKACIRNLAATDACGNLQIGQVDFYRQGNGFWQTAMPLVSVSEFRPSLLTSARSIPHSARSLVVRSIEIKDIQGLLGDRNSFTGTGELIFANPPKRNLQNSILAIPAELLTRIGLDLAVLTPIRGTVLFDIRDGKAILNRFKDVYSKNRLSKFYLADNGFKSYVDFDGNLNLQVRMKQYNIIFKLAELFTFTVKGTLRKPSYALLTQHPQNIPYKEGS